MPQLLIQRAQEAASLAEHLKGELLNFFQSDADRNSRWEAYLAWYRLGGAPDTWSYGGWDGLIPEVGEVFGYEGFIHCDRYQTRDLVECLSLVEEVLISTDEVQAKILAATSTLMGMDATDPAILAFDDKYNYINGDLAKGFYECKNLATTTFIENDTTIKELLEKLQDQLMVDAVSEFTFDW